MTPGELQRFRNGDPELFRELVERHSPRLLSLAGAFVAHRDEAHDLVQETWVRAYAKRATYAGRGSILSWLLAVCRSVCVSHGRRPGTVRAAQQRQAESLVEHVPGTESPERDLERVGLRRSLIDSLIELPERQREAVVCRLIEGRSTRETARLMGCAEGTVKASLHAALGKLRERLAEWSPTSAADEAPDTASIRGESVAGRAVGDNALGVEAVGDERR